MTEDIRDKSHVSHDDVVGLNFITNKGAFVFRRYYKQGLRSHIMEVLSSSDVHKQNKGEVINGIRHFPWAKPKKILRIFRTKFESLAPVLKEIEKYKIIEKYLPRDSYSASCEFITDYIIKGAHDLILCGFQDYVAGKVLNPWDLVHENFVVNLVNNMRHEGSNPLNLTTEQFVQRVRKQAANFIDGLKDMILEAHHVPDLAGVGNLILTPVGNIKLVDINNISRVSLGPDISLDDRGYPVCDKSIEAIAIIEQKLLQRTIDRTATLYKVFLDPQRIERVARLEEIFHHSLRPEDSCPK
jgi:hypothetical protein